MTNDRARAASAAPMAIIKIAITCPDKTLEADSVPNIPPGANLEKATNDNAAALNINSRLIIIRTALFFVKVPNKPMIKMITETIRILPRVTINPYSQQS